MLVGLGAGHGQIIRPALSIQSAFEAETRWLGARLVPGFDQQIAPGEKLEALTGAEEAIPEIIGCALVWAIEGGPEPALDDAQDGAVPGMQAQRPAAGQHPQTGLARGRKCWREESVDQLVHGNLLEFNLRMNHELKYQ